MKKFFTILVMCFAVLAAKAQVTVILEAHDVWGDGSGYQLLLDADATAFGTIIPTSGALNSSGDVDAATYAEFEYKIPENADGALTTTNMVYDGSVTITIPAGTYDFCVTNPTPGARMWIAGGEFARQDDFVFVEGWTYHFTVAREGNGDAVSIEATNDAVAVAPTAFTATPAADHSLSVDLSWTNPTTTCGGTTLTAITSIVLTRDGETIETFDNPTVGGAMTFTDNTMTTDGSYTYTVYAVTEAGDGLAATARVSVGNVCEYRIEMADSYGDGWNGAAIEVYDATNILIGSYTVDGSENTELVTLAVGTYTFSWTSGSYDDECSFVIYDPFNIAIYTGSSAPAAGTFLTHNNTCEEPTPFVEIEGEAVEFAAAVGGTSLIQAFAVNSYGLTANISVVASEMFEVSLDGETFATTATITAGADFAANDLYVRFAPTAAGAQTGTITCTSGELSDVLNVTGEGVVCDAITTFPYTCEFNRGSAEVLCWNIVDANGDGSTFNFFDFDEEGNPGVAAYMYNESSSANDYLISPEMTLPENAAVRFSYRAASSTYPEALSAYIIPEGATYESAVQILSTVQVSNTTWEEASINLNSYVGQTVSIAFKAESEANMYWLAIDHFVVDQSASVEESALSQVSIYPNPASTVLNVHAENYSNVQIINFLGQVVYSANVTENDFQINVSNLSNGVYFIRLNGETTTTQKFIKK